MASVVLLAGVWTSGVRADSAGTTARALVADWKAGDREMAAIAEVIASAFASGMSWAGVIEGHQVYCPPPTVALSGNQVMSVLDYLRFGAYANSRLTQLVASASHVHEGDRLSPRAVESQNGLRRRLQDDPTPSVFRNMRSPRETSARFRPDPLPRSTGRSRLRRRTWLPPST